MSAPLPLALLIATVVNGFIAPLKVHFRAEPSMLDASAAGSAIADAPFVGLALSGGGARAAVFGAAGMKALNARGLLAPATHVSSMSGGGFLAPFLALHAVPESGPSGIYFSRMQDVVAHEATRIDRPAQGFNAGVFKDAAIPQMPILRRQRASPTGAGKSRTKEPLTETFVFQVRTN